MRTNDGGRARLLAVAAVTAGVALAGCSSPSSGATADGAAATNAAPGGGECSGSWTCLDEVTATTGKAVLAPPRSDRAELTSSVLIRTDGGDKLSYSYYAPDERVHVRISASRGSARPIRPGPRETAEALTVDGRQYSVVTGSSPIVYWTHGDWTYGLGAAVPIATTAEQRASRHVLAEMASRFVDTEPRPEASAS